MPSTPDSILRLELQATGENATTWGVKTNNNLELLGQAIAGAANVNVGGSGNYTLVASNYTTDEARAATLVLTGVLSGNRDVIVPSSPKHYTIINQTSGAFPLTIRQVSGTGAAIPAGSSQIVCTSTTCVALNYVSKAGDTMTGALEVNNSITSRGIVPEVKYIETDTGTTIRTLVDGSAWDIRRDDYSILMSVRNSNGQILAGQTGTAAAPAYSFTGDPDTGIFSGGANLLSLSIGGVRTAEIAQSSFILENRAGDANLTYFGRATDASATNARGVGFIAVNENSVPVASTGYSVATDGSGSIELYAAPAGSRTSDRRVNRMTIPGSGAISMVGPVNVSSGDMDVAGSLRFNSGYGSAAIAYGVRAWVNFNGTGTVAIRASGGVTSITDNGTGDYTVNFNFTMPDANYGANINVSESGVAGGSATEAASIISQATTSFRFACKYSYSIFSAGATSGRFDPSIVSASVVR